MTLLSPENQTAARLWRGVSAMLCVAGAALLVMVGAGVAGAQEGAAAAEIELQEMRTALDVARKQLDESDRKAEALRESLAESNRVGGEVRAQYEELLLRMASFGVDLVKPDEKSLEQRLLQAVRDRDRVEREKAEIAASLAELSEALVGYLQAAVVADPEARARAESALAAADAALGKANQGAAHAGSGTATRPITDGQVVSVDSEIGLVVVNVGRAGGVRVGMPITVKRDSREIVSALVVDVRDAIAGALIEESIGGEVRVGDRIEPRADAL